MSPEMTLEERYAIMGVFIIIHAGFLLHAFLSSLALLVMGMISARRGRSSTEFYVLAAALLGWTFLSI